MQNLDLLTGDYENNRLIRSELQFVQDCLDAAAFELARGHVPKAQVLVETAKRSHDDALDEIAKQSDQSSLSFANLLRENIRDLEIEIQTYLSRH